MTEITIIQRYPFSFYGDDLVAYLCSDATLYIPLVGITKTLGLDHKSQLSRARKSPVLYDHMVILPIETEYRDSTRIRDVACISVKRIPFWLGMINTNKVKKGLRGKVVLYQRELADVAWAAFREDIVPSDALSELDSYEAPEEAEYLQVMADVEKLRRKIQSIYTNVDERVKRIEAQLINRLLINQAQSKAIKDIVTTLSMARANTNKRKSRAKHFAEGWDKFKERFEIPVYSVLDADKYEEAIDYLQGEWEREFPGEKIPEVILRARQKRMF